MAQRTGYAHLINSPSHISGAPHLPGKRLLFSVLAISLIAFSPATFAQQVASPRDIVPLSGAGWQFHGAGKTDTLPEISSAPFESGPWTDVTVPHDFQTRHDITIEQGWYRRKFSVPEAELHKHLYLMFEGAASIADVYLNGQHLGQHRGAYTRFIFDATATIHPGENELAVQVDNRGQSITDCLPNGSRLYTVWGGLYRHVWLLATNDLQIDPTYYASPGVFITPTEVSAQSAKLSVRVLLKNTSSANKNASVSVSLFDPQNRLVQTWSGQASVSPNQSTPLTVNGTVQRPLLWEPRKPELYHVRVDVTENGRLADSITQPTGFRSMVWDFKQGTLQLNGQPCVLYGADMHQEDEKKSSALEPEDFVKLSDELVDLGATFVRLPHYPHAQIEYDLCDERGIFCWAENGHSNNEKPTPTADQITTELVEQNYNHPSIAMWSVGNEASEDTADHEVPVVRALDSTRPVMVANMKCALCDYRGANTYPGWYGGDRWNFHPHGIISEVGAGGVVTSHTDYATATHKTNSYEPEEYQQLVGETLLEEAFRHNDGKLGIFTWWVLREFNDTKYKSGEAPFKHGINSKGLVTFGGLRKDVYYLYRSFLRPELPTLHITSKCYFLRQGDVNNGIKVYGNAKAVTLILNGQTISTLQNGQYSQNKTATSEIDNVFYWPVPLRTGWNTVLAKDDVGTTDTATIYFYGANGAPAAPDPLALITDLTSSNPTNPAYCMDMPVHEQWPIYYDFDSTADNSLDTLPNQVQGASWLALHRVTKTGEATDVSCTIAKRCTVYVICTKRDSDPAFLTNVGFSEVKTDPFQWREDDLILTPAQLFSKLMNPGDTLKLSLGERDALVLFKAG